MVAHTGLEPVISALRGQRVNQLHQCATVGLWDYRCPLTWAASGIEIEAEAAFEIEHACARRHIRLSVLHDILRVAIQLFILIW